MHTPRSVSGRVPARISLVLLVGLAVIGLSSCGGSNKTEKLTVSETQSGPKAFSYTGVRSLSGGTVKITFTNAAKGAQHELQLVRVDAGHTTDELKATFTKLIGGNNHVPIPGWLHPAGGVGVLNPGQTATATMKNGMTKRRTISLTEGGSMATSSGERAATAPVAFFTSDGIGRESMSGFILSAARTRAKSKDIAGSG